MPADPAIPAALIQMLELGLKVLIAYFLGSVMGGVLMGRLRGGVDLSKVGSGNIGGTNALRTQGSIFALGVVVVDVGKGALAAGLVPGLDLPGAGTDPALDRTWLQLCCAGAAVVGHVFPVWHQFRGGKGAATLVGAYAVLAPLIIVPMVLVWLGVIVLTGFVGLATIVTAWATALIVATAGGEAGRPLLVFSVAAGLFMLWTHRSNIARMRAGNENRNERLMIFRPRSHTKH
jgi:glycerol-3-phosphate acyltransferase PlsY